MPEPADILDDIARTFRAPFVPSDFAALHRDAREYLEYVWRALRVSVETQGYLNSALYVADMALDAVEQVYEPVLTPDLLRARGLHDPDLEQLVAVLDVMHYTQPQLLLALAALAEAWERDRVGGQGRIEARPVTDRETRHLRTEVVLARPDGGVLPAVADALGTPVAPDLFRAVAAWPAYLVVAWEEHQHLATYPEFRRRGRGLYYYARSGARFLAEPLEANPDALRAAGVPDAAIEAAHAILDAAVPQLAMMTMHVEAMRVGLGVHAREVVTG